MHELVIMPATSAAEVDEALRLACDVFADRNPAAGYPEYKATLWRDDPAFTNGNVIIGRTPTGEVAGVVRIVPRTLHRVAQVMRVAGISSVCVNPAFRGRGYSVAIMEHALRHCQSLGFDVALLIARRAADHYYTQFGFWGVSSYNRVSIAASKAPRGAAPEIGFQAAYGDWIDHYSRAYAESYSSSFGWFARSRPHWVYLVKRLSLLPGVEFRTITLRGAPVGYVVIGNGSILEAAFIEALTADQLVRALVSYTGAADNFLQLDLPPEHRLCGMLENFDWSIRFRECSYGGHMVRILNPTRVANSLAERVHIRLDQLGATRYAEACGDFRLTFDGSKCEVHAPAGAGPLSYEQTCWLLGIRTPASPLTVDVRLPFNVSFPDQV